jgi:hypothetical protein
VATFGKAREILASMRQRGYAENNLMAFEQELNEPPPERVEAVRRLLEQHNHLSAEISRKTAGRGLPSHAGAQALLQEVMAKVSP